MTSWKYAPTKGKGWACLPGATCDLGGPRRFLRCQCWSTLAKVSATLSSVQGSIQQSPAPQGMPLSPPVNLGGSLCCGGERLFRCMCDGDVSLSCITSFLSAYKRKQAPRGPRENHQACRLLLFFLFE